jgi:hypothetical protein
METVLSDEAVAQSLAQDRPTIDTAIKSYVGWFVARSLTMQDKVTNAEAVGYARILLKAINGYKFDNAKSTSNIAAVVVKVWHGLIDSDQKPSRFLGRIALLHAWDGIVDTISTSSDEATTLFVQEFGDLLKDFTPQVPSEDSNCHLIWDEPGAELERRRQRRNQRVEENKIEKRDNVTPIIEEITEEGDEEVKDS